MILSPQAVIFIFEVKIKLFERLTPRSYYKAFEGVGEAFKDGLKLKK